MKKELELESDDLDAFRQRAEEVEAQKEQKQFEREQRKLEKEKKVKDALRAKFFPLVLMGLLFFVSYLVYALGK